MFPGQVPAAVLALVSFLVVPATGAAAVDPCRLGAQSGGHELVVEKLLASYEVDDVDADVLASELGRIESAVGPLFRILAESGIPSEWTPEGEGFHALRETQRAAVRAALGKISRNELRAFMDAITVAERRFEWRRTAVLVVGDFGQTKDLHLLIELATPLEEEAVVVVRSMRLAFQEGLAQILERDPNACSYLEDQFVEVHTGLRSSIVDVVAEHSSEQALSTLARMLNRVPEIDPFILSAITRVAGRLDPPAGDEAVRRQVRALLTRVDRRLVEGAARAAGKLEDYESVPILLDLLEDGDPNLRGSAHRSLQEITGLGFRPDLRLWLAWHERESRWWEDHSEAAFRDLQGSDPVKITQAISQVSRQRLRRHQLAARLAECLTLDDPALVKTACEGLSQLRSPAAIPDLVESLEHDDWAVRQAALRALCRITGRQLPPDPELWRKLS